MALTAFLFFIFPFFSFLLMHCITMGSSGRTSGREPLSSSLPLYIITTITKLTTKTNPAFTVAFLPCFFVFCFSLFTMGRETGRVGALL
ncbi:hypothetical protein K440DRAFT_314354 [Wilcoxina mikolae CBS 423.85]|nr:hypothetical protein K440DRAFT_314354 [Wilcoxina mikolae CBS 423.85]